MIKKTKTIAGKMVAFFFAAVLIFSMTACSSTTSSYSGQTVTGQVTKIDGTKVTLQLGELSEESGKGQDGEEPPEKPDGDAQNGEEPPEKPDGESQDSENQDGENQDDEIQDGETQDKTTQNGEDTSEKSKGDTDSTENKEASSGESSTENKEASSEENSTADEKKSGEAPQGGMGPGTFTAGDETVTLDLKNATIKLEKGPETEDGDLDDIQENAILTVEVGSGNAAKTVTVKSVGGDNGSSGEVNQGTAANTISEDGSYTDETYSSDGDDENALRVENAEVTLDGITVEKTGGSCSDSDAGNFYGMNGALLATDGATVTIQNSKFSSDAQNANAAFSYGEGTVVNIADSEITTSSDNSGGIQTAGGGTTNATNLTIKTSGNSSAAIRSDRGGGTVNVDGGSYESNGYNSPAVYSTASITVKDADLTATNSEALVIEGQNSISLDNCNVIGNMSDTEGSSSSENVHNVMIYQSMSGDAEVGTSEFSMSGGKLTSQNGDMFYVTNTNCKIELTDVELENQDTDAYLFRICGNGAQQGWGESGKNGGNAEITVKKQSMSGDIVVDSISTMQLTLSDGSSYTGSINISDNAQNGTAVENNAVVTVEEGCTWTLTGNCTLTSLQNNGTIQFNGYTITLADGTVLSE